MRHRTGVSKRFNMAIGSFARCQRGVTGLETAIILIAFVVVASVFAFTVLSTGIFSSERGKETLFAGLKEAQGTLGMSGAVVANGATEKTLSLGETAWLAGTSNSTHVTSTLDSVDKKEGSNSADLEIGSAFTTGIIAYENLTATVDLSSNDSIQVWIKSGTTTAANDLQLVIDDSSNCGSSLEDINLPVLTAGEWKNVTLAISDNSDMTAVKCVGLDVVTDNGAYTVNLDDITAPGQATSIEFVVTNGVGGEAVDLRSPSDSDANGIADSDSKNTLVLTYSDKNQVVSDIYWTKDFIGDNDSDDLLEIGEKAKFTVNLTALANDNPLVKDLTFTIEAKPAEGAVLVIQRTMPSPIDTVNNLK